MFFLFPRLSHRHSCLVTSNSATLASLCWFQHVSSNTNDVSKQKVRLFVYLSLFDNSTDVS